MRGRKQIIAIGFSLFPLYALAHGQEVLIPFLLQLCSIFIFVFWMAAAKWRIAIKLKLAAAYFLTLILIIGISCDLPYSSYRTVIDLVWSLAPGAAAFVTFLLIANKNNQKNVP